MPNLPDVDAAAVLAYRVLHTGLLRTHGLAELPGWDLGFQDRSGSSRLAVGIRLADPGELPAAWADPDGPGAHVLGWTLRGGIVCAHRRADLPQLAAALWPADSEVAAVFLQAEGARLVERGVDPLAALTEVRDAMRAVVTRPMTKGAVSAAITERIDETLSSWCQPCGSTHVHEGLFRVAALPAGLGAAPNTKPVVVARYRPGVRPGRGAADLGPLVAAYYRDLGAGTAMQVGQVLGLPGRFITPLMPDTLVPARVAGNRSMVHPDLLASGDRPDRLPARLLPSTDPLLLARDRDLMVPEPAARKELWTAVGQPGAILVGGAIAGTWRSHLASGRLTVELRPWHKLSKSDTDTLRAEAELIANIRGATDLQALVTR